MPIDAYVQKTVFGKKMYLTIYNKLKTPLPIKVMLKDSNSKEIETSVPGSSYKDFGQKEGLFLNANDIIIIENEKYQPFKIMVP